MEKQLKLALILVVLQLSCFGQEKNIYYPKIGEKIKDHSFNNLVNYSGREVSISHFKGQWLILDFWASTCSACIASFNKMNKLSQAFSGRVNLLMVGSYTGMNERVDGLRKTKLLYEYNAKLYNLTFNVAFDSTIVKKFSIQAIPQVLIINPEGKIVAKTISIDSAQLEMVLKGQSPNLKYSYSRDEEIINNKDYDINLPLLTTGREANGGVDTSILFRSILTKWNPKMPGYTQKGFWDVHDKKLNDSSENIAELFGYDLPSMLRVAYTGYPSWMNNLPVYKEFYHQIIIECKDKSKFDNRDQSGNVDHNAYSYSVISDNLTPDYARKQLMFDIERYFDFVSSAEIRQVPVWMITVINKKRAESLRSKGGTRSVKSINTFGGYNFTNWSISDLADQAQILRDILLKKYGNDLTAIPPIIDATGINFNVDISIEGYRRDFDAVKKSLNKSGLDLILGTYSYKCIVVKDK